MAGSSFMLSFSHINEGARGCVRKLALGVVCLCLLDVLLGGLSRWIFFQQRSGKFYRIYRAMASADQKLFIFGSSHAASHYVPEILEKDLAIRSYNAGTLGQQILFHRTLEAIILDRMTPDVIVLDVDPSTLYQATEPYDRLADLKPFYFRYPDIIGPVLCRRSKLERLFLQSKLYQYNSTVAHVLRYWLSPQPDWNGYRPEYKIMAAPTAVEVRDEMVMRNAYAAGRKVDPVMVDALERFAVDAKRKGVRVFFFVSPGAVPYELKSNASFLKAQAIAAQGGVPFYNFRNHPEYVHHYEFFADSGHLNDVGARRYSKLVAKSIRERLAVEASAPSVGNPSKTDAHIPARFQPTNLVGSITHIRSK
jgi:hypothetical protein